ncbi:FecR domain-containing protein [Pseudomonas sp. Marseille-P9899]|uniref:FecR domain-containing protein n=1 Tax=Pseudomonas sp. Marseille-P9899 TaxID=2730401 RepID=UPI00158C8EA4|nr:FecR domain-containing protein [Pseudomonas sp. Marseille-P9899]
MSSAKHAEPPISARVRDQALAWLSLTQSGEISEAELQQLQRWRQSDSEHERAWQRMARLPGMLHNHAQVLDNPVARSALQHTRYVSGDRRQVLKLLFGVGVLGAAAWHGKDSHWVQSELADLSTATGERLYQTLADGTQVWLNTGSAVDIRFSANERLIVLRFGEVDILTGNDPAHRPLRVQTHDALLQPLGTRFCVRCDEAGSGTRLSVSSGRVAVSVPGRPAQQVVEAGTQAFIDARGVSRVRPANPGSTAWIDGFIVAERMRLGDFVAQLARYRRGILRCDPAVADLQLTGSYPLDDPERIFSLLQDSLPVSVQRRTRYWVTVTPRRVG